MNTVPPALLLGLSQHTEDGWLDVSTTSASSGEERQQQLSSFKQVQQWATARAPLHVPQVAQSSLVYIYVCPVVWFVQHAEDGWQGVSTVATSTSSNEDREQLLSSFKQVHELVM